MKYDFSHDKYLFPRYCMSCKKTNSPLEDHHIKGRRNGLHSSPFNCIRVCKSCHDKVVQSDEVAVRFLKITFNYLFHKKYKPTEKDYSFMEYYINLYVRIQGKN